MLNVAWCMRKIRAAPPHSSAVRPPTTEPVSATPRPNAAASPAITHSTNVPVDEPDQRVGEQVLRVAPLVGDLHVAEDPADVRVREAAQRPAPTRAVTDVRAVGVAIDVGELVVLAVRRDPVDHRPFGGGRARAPRTPARSRRLHLKLRCVSSR